MDFGVGGEFSQPALEGPTTDDPASLSGVVCRRFLRAATAFYLLLPIGLFAYGWLRPAYAVPVLALTVVVLAITARELWQAARSGWRALPDRSRAAREALTLVAPAGLLLAAWLLLSGAGGLGYQNDDYRASNALLKELILSDWPLRFQFDGQPVRLVYYVGYYLPAAMMGKAGGWLAANAALWVWTATGCALAFAWFVRLSGAALRGRAGRLLVLAALFCLSGGLDFIAVSARQGAPPGLTAHLEFWAGYFQYSSQTTLLYWVPQQTVAAWLLTGLVLDAIYDPHDLRYLGLSLAAGLLWSPLGVLGLLPLLLLLAGVYARAGHWSGLLRPSALIAHACAIGLALVVGLYLTANRYNFPMGWAWQLADDPLRLARYYLVFVWLEFGVLALLLVLVLRVGTWRGGAVHARLAAVLIASLLTLTLLPLYRFGFNNDLVMRASIPSLLVLWMFVGKAVLDARPAVSSLRLRLAYGLLVGVVALGMVPGLTEVARSVQHYRLGPPPLEAIVPMADADPRHLVEQRVGEEEAFFFRYLGR